MDLVVIFSSKVKTMRQVGFSERACGFVWPEDIKVDVLGQHLAGTRLSAPLQASLTAMRYRKCSVQLRCGDLAPLGR